MYTYIVAYATPDSYDPIFVQSDTLYTRDEFYNLCKKIEYDLYNKVIPIKHYAMDDNSIYCMIDNIVLVLKDSHGFTIPKISYSYYAGRDFVYR